MTPRPWHMMNVLRAAHATVSCITLTAAVGCSDDLPKASLISHMRVLGALSEVAGDPQRSSPKPGETTRLTWKVVYPDAATDDSALTSLFVICTEPEEFSDTPVCQELIDAAESGQLEVAGSGGLESGESGSEPQPEATAPLAVPGCAPYPDILVTQITQIPGLQALCVTNTPRFDVPIPQDVRGEARLIRGVICRNGTPSVDSQNLLTPTCVKHPGTDDADFEQIDVYATVRVQYSDADRNLNPVLDVPTDAQSQSPLQLQFDAKSWRPTPSPPSTLSDAACMQAVEAGWVPRASGEDDETIKLSYDDAAREPLPDGGKERLEFSTYTTFGDLDRRFSVFASDAEPPLEDELTWKLNDDQRDMWDGQPRSVRFYFAVLDRRGGFAFTTRDLCVYR